MTLLQLHPMVPMQTPLGSGLCFMVADYSEEADSLWVVADDKTGQIWWWPNSQVRFCKNISMGRTDPEIPKSKGLPT